MLKDQHLHTEHGFVFLSKSKSFCVVFCFKKLYINFISFSFLKLDGDENETLLKLGKVNFDEKES